VPWPAEVGKLLPGAEDAYGIHEKLAGYSLKLGHPGRGRKAEGFARVLAVTADDVEYLAEALLGGIRTTPVSRVRPAGEYGSQLRGHRAGAWASRPRRSSRERPDGVADPVEG